MLRDLEDSDLEPGLVTAVLAASTSSGAAREKLLEGDVFADLAEERHQEQTVAAVLLLLLPVAGALLGVAEVILLGVVALAEEQLQEQIVAAVPLLVAVTLPGAAVVILLEEAELAVVEVAALLVPFLLAAVAVEVELLEPYAPAAAAEEHQEHFSLVPCYSRFAVAVVVVGPAQIAAVEVELV